jgi:hypothetical protein
MLPREWPLTGFSRLVHAALRPTAEPCLSGSAGQINCPILLPVGISPLRGVGSLTLINRTNGAKATTFENDRRRINFIPSRGRLQSNVGKA